MQKFCAIREILAEQEKNLFEYWKLWGFVLVTLVVRLTSALSPSDSSSETHLSPLTIRL